MIHQTQPISKENDHHKLLPSTKDKETNQEQMALTIDSDLVEGTTQALANYRVFQQASYSIQEDTGLRDIYKEEQDLIRCLRKAAAPDQPVEEFLTDFSAMTTVQKVDHLAKKLLPKEKDLLKAKQSGLLNDLEVPEFPDWQSRRHLMSALIVEIKNRVVYKHNPLTPKSLAQIMETGETEASVKSIIQPYFDRIS
jgi:hypothetical protein